MSNKPRKAKHNPMLDKLAENQARRALSSVWIADGKMLDGLTHTGIYDRWYPVPAGQNAAAWQLYVAEKVVDMIACRDLDWSIWYAVFETHGVTIGEPMERHGISNNLGDEVHSALSKLVESRNPKYAISYGWLAVPCKNIDWDAIQNDVIAKFKEWRAFDREYCGLMNANRAIREGIAIIDCNAA